MGASHHNAALQMHQGHIMKLKTAVTSVCALLSIAGSLSAAEKSPHWAYRGHHGGPAHWAELDPAFEACAQGKAQSPINIQSAVKADLPALQFSYGQAEPSIVNNGHTIQVNLPKGQTLTVDSKRYTLVQFHFHTPSEEQIGGKHAAMVAHFVHKDEEGRLGVVGVMLQPGKTNPHFAPVFDHLPRPGETISVEGLQLDLAALLPSNLAYYRFAGSLTTPPCSEGVQWMVLKQPVQLGPEQIKAFRRLYSANARPIQPTNGRLIEESR